jgi:hypothetical protein
MNPSKETDAAIAPLIAYSIPQSPLSATDEFVKSVIKTVSNLGFCSSSNIVISCALTVAATAIAQAIAKRIMAVPDQIVSFCTAMLKKSSHEFSKSKLPWEAKQPSEFLRLLHFVLRLLRPRMHHSLLGSMMRPIVNLLESSCKVDIHVTVPEKCTNDIFGAKPNTVFSDLVWYTVNNNGTVNGLELVQDGASGLREIRPGMLSDDVVREYEHGDYKISLVMTKEAGTNSIGSKVSTRSVKLSASSMAKPVESIAPINAFIAHVQALRLASTRDLVWKPVVNHWVDNAWKEKNIPSRKTFEHVALREKDKLKKDIEAFLASEPVYRNMGLCWNRGYLLHGPPGCGKSSCVSAIACTYRLPVYNINLREIESDVALRSMFSSLPERVMVVMEDVDCMTDSVLADRDQKKDETKSKSKVSLSGLLNVLDGIETGGGRLLVMTTNHKSKLDPALVRPGRCDVHLEVGYCTFEHAEFLTKLYLGVQLLDRDALEVGFATANVTPAMVAGLLLPVATNAKRDEDQCLAISQQLVELCDRVKAEEAAKEAARAAAKAATEAETATKFAVDAKIVAEAKVAAEAKMRQSNGGNSSSNSSNSVVSPETP